MNSGVERATGNQGKELDMFLMLVGKSMPQYLDAMEEEARAHAIVRQDTELIQ